MPPSSSCKDVANHDEELSGLPKPWTSIQMVQKREISSASVVDGSEERDAACISKKATRSFKSLVNCLGLCSSLTSVTLLLVIFANVTNLQYLKGDVTQVSDHRQNKNHKSEKSSSSFGSRNILVFNHNPKAGGGSIKQVMNDLRTHEVIPTGNTTLRKILNQQPNWNAKNSYFYIKESARSTKAIRRQGYIIGSIREPCNQYVSLWSFGSHKSGGFYKEMEKYYKKHTREDDKLSDYYGHDAPLFDTNEDIERFQRWMHHPVVQGRISTRVKSIYSTTNQDDNIDGVDCYVYVEQFQSSLIDCLQKFEAQGGHIDWSTPLIAAMLHSNNKDQNNDHNNGRRIVALNNRSHSKDNPLESPQAYHHAPCTTYFHNVSLLQEMQNGPEKFIYDTFGYEGCCSKEFRKNY